MSAARHKNQRQSDSQRYAPFVLLAGAQTLTQKCSSLAAPALGVMHY
ncbi:hypothetical protein SAMN05660479_02233 [Microbulbifer thermotolerans]|nr:hypothetical protein SAMN05660479_02233 [Microbulbifer thermotolerans]